jgi:alpha-galactosidase
MLEVGNGGMTTTEYRTHFSMWNVLAAPLIYGNDLRSMTPDIRDILTNKEVLRFDRDSLGHEGRVWKDSDSEIWSKEMKDGSRAVVLLNRGRAGSEIAVYWEQIGYPGHLSAAVRDLWVHKDLGTFTGSFKAAVPSHGAVVVIVSP